MERGSEKEGEMEREEAEEGIRRVDAKERKEGIG